ncbi:MAG: biosynthetic-type acetolactate synthase large subunit [Spirochaetales bacterium]|nr:biosynthetic-type acetolactate synthase large subunit [Spirochaetales bacterium]
MKMNGAELIIALLERQGIEIVTGILGGANLPLYKALAQSSIQHVLARHEQGAGFMAHGMARSTGRPAVCFVTSGPGVTNVLTAVTDAKMDSVPIIVICGQVPTAFLGTDAFQEINTLELCKPITKKSYLATKARDLLMVIPEAFSIAQSGRQGPVVIDVPKDVQLADIEFEVWPDSGQKTAGAAPDKDKIKQIARAINQAGRPLIYAGGGVIASGTHNELYELAKTGNIPLVSTLMGLGCFPARDPLFLGMLGMHGLRATNNILDETDLLIALGVRFDDRATGKVKEFCPQAKIIHIDIDEREIDKIKKADLAVAGDLKAVFRQLLPLIQAQERYLWTKEISEIQCRFPEFIPEKNDARHPLALLKQINSSLPANTIVTTDVGQHQMWTAQGYGFSKPRTLLTSGGLGTMGFGLPAAIGAALANPDKNILCISGDGSLYMNIQELVTLAELDLNITIILFNNNQLGLVRQQQELFYDKIYAASCFEKQMDFAVLAEAFGIKAVKLTEADDVTAVLKQAGKESGPMLIEIPISGTENVYPIVAPGKANREMVFEDSALGERKVLTF